MTLPLTSVNSQAPGADVFHEKLLFPVAAVKRISTSVPSPNVTAVVEDQEIKTFPPAALLTKVPPDNDAFKDWYPVYVNRVVS